MGGNVRSSHENPIKKGRAALDAVAGALAGAVSRVVVGPLDVVKIRMQVQLEPIRAGGTSKYTGIGQAMKCIVREEGVVGLWRGTVPALVLTAPYCAVQFAVLKQSKEFFRRHGFDTPRWTAAGSFLSGATAGAAATLASYPFDLLRTVLACQGSPPVYRGMTDAAVSIFKQRGVPGLFAGVGITLAEILPYAGIQFGVYDSLNTASARWIDTQHMSPSMAAGRTFLVGLLSGFIGKGLTHPIDVVKKRYQVTGLQRSLTYGERVDTAMTASLRKCVHRIWLKEGVPGFYKGLNASLLKAAPASAVTFLAYECFVAMLLKWDAARKAQP